MSQNVSHFATVCGVGITTQRLMSLRDGGIDPAAALRCAAAGRG
jgi:hypothetical protein